ncbi:response regulator [Chitinilyticum litopenaei]|uniref:response regulator n=1 Tax=Chitinilyticum litopenaei TaxID=1121276 RepID=UPI0003FDEA95|nr:HD domain-containing phosphohydrolase [Chitinilyticum litopenaei]
MNSTDLNTSEHSEPATILVVDDEPANIGLLAAVLKPHYRVRAARSGSEALRAIASPPQPDLVLLDIMMPGMDGYSVLDILHKDAATRHIPVIFVTAMDSSDSEQQGLLKGAVDYITKPISPPILLARIHTQLELKSARDRLQAQNSRLEEEVAKRTRALKLTLEKKEAAHSELKKSYFSTLLAINGIIELRGGGIGEHSRRVAELARQTARRLGLDDEEVQDIFIAALLHDIGHISFPDELQHKPVNTMNSAELGVYRRHCLQGADILRKIDSLAHIAGMIQDHHEYFDGTGFPAGKSGLNIPIGARIIAAASDYDDFRAGLLTTTPLSARESLDFLLENRGHRYDPRVIDFMEPLLTLEVNSQVEERRVSAVHLQDGMMLSRDVMHPDGFLLLSKSTVLNRNLIDQVVLAEKQCATALSIYVLNERISRPQKH